MQGKFLFKCAALAMAVGLLVGGCGSNRKDSKVIKIHFSSGYNCIIIKKVRFLYLAFN